MNLILPLFCTLATSIASAQSIQIKERLVKETRSQVQVPLNTARCSALGYGRSEMKISVPALKGVAFFDHANVGEADPCMTAGACTDSFNADTFKTEFSCGSNLSAYWPADLHVVLSEKFSLDLANKTCTREVIENVSMMVGDVPFTHLRSKDFGTFPFELCEQI